MLGRDGVLLLIFVGFSILYLQSPNCETSFLCDLISFRLPYLLSALQKAFLTSTGRGIKTVFIVEKSLLRGKK